MDLPDDFLPHEDHLECTQNTILTLWKFIYHTGQREAARCTPLYFSFLYAVDETEARTKLKILKKSLGEVVYEDVFEPCPWGFNTGKRWFAGKVSVDPDGTLRPYPASTRATPKPP